MGGVEDDEPPTKRVKVFSGDSRVHSCNISAIDQGGSSLSDSMARLLTSQEDDDIVGTKGVIKKTELIRIIAEALYSLGYSKSGARLEEESGIPLHSGLVDLFMKQILDGHWDESLATLHEMDLMDDKIIKLASFVILEQKFFELLDGKKIMDALKTLRADIAPLCVNNDRVRELSYSILNLSLEMSDDRVSGQEMRLKSRKELLEELQKLLPPTVIIPENRLVHLVEQALDLQRDACRYHNSSVGEMSLLTDHQCGKDHIPCQTHQSSVFYVVCIGAGHSEMMLDCCLVLHEHGDEVWFVQFSRNGKYLASSSGNCIVIIWEVMADEQVCVRHRLTGHQRPVSYITWSPDDRQILTCGTEEVVRRWDVVSGECLRIYEKSGLGLVSCGWAADGQSVFSGVSDKSICMWDTEGKEMECWKGQKTIRIADMGVTKDGKELITVCKETSILLFEWERNSEKFIEEDQIITSFTVSDDRKFLLVSLLNEELHLWNIDGVPKVISKYKGHKRSRFVVRSCFGGLDEAFIGSGSEDSQVYIWHRVSGELILTLGGHSGAVNCVSWNPTNPHMLASGSDDRTIRIWGLNRMDSSAAAAAAVSACSSSSSTAASNDHTNGVANGCNGKTL
ncbi:hypothetical protein M569_14740 [Genlisea aurea]|uniref:CTLH domain-containing protein n=1 Tax=Genlisea aurea TaxID=192259 RepID=S8DBG2_9LAMI|nr:hypothetical protein M569_14740 [Genlisea aurea]